MISKGVLVTNALSYVFSILFCILTQNLKSNI